MVVPSSAQLQAFNGGQMTDLPAYPGGADPTALMEIVSPGNADQGINYAITLNELALLIGGGGGTVTIIIAGSVYNSVATDTKILVNKTIGGPITINLLAANLYTSPILIKDLKGDSDVNNITVAFAGTYDGMASPLTISTQFGWIWFNPLASGNWYAS